MNKNTLRFGAAFVALVIATVVGVGYALAHGQWAEKRAEIKEAIENNDYESFVGAIGEDSKFGDSITAENFSQYVEAITLKKAGDYEGAKQIFEDLGIKGYHGGYHKGFYSTEKHAAIKAAIESNDYNAWVEAKGDYGKHADSITAENFSQYVEAITLKEAGDYEGAKQIFEDLGLTKSGRHHYWKK